jgi:hypothetical protein
LRAMNQGSPLLDHEFDDHESRKGIAKTPQNQRSPDRQKLPIARERATEQALTTFDRIFSLCKLKLTWWSKQSGPEPAACPLRRPSRGKSLASLAASQGRMDAFSLFRVAIPCSPTGVPIAGTPFFRMAL